MTLKLFKLFVAATLMSFVFIEEILAEDIFSYLPPNNLISCGQTYVINAHTSIDSLNTYFLNLFKNIDNNFSNNPYSIIVFSNLNELQIDSAINKLVFKNI